jgi:hypothetical protein
MTLTTPRPLASRALGSGFVISNDDDDEDTKKVPITASRRVVIDSTDIVSSTRTSLSGKAVESVEQPSTADSVDSEPSLVQKNSDCKERVSKEQRREAKRARKEAKKAKKKRHHGSDDDSASSTSTEPRSANKKKRWAESTGADEAKRARHDSLVTTAAASNVQISSKIDSDLKSDCTTKPSSSSQSHSAGDLKPASEVVSTDM